MVDRALLHPASQQQPSPYGGLCGGTAHHPLLLSPLLPQQQQRLLDHNPPPFRLAPNAFFQHEGPLGWDDAEVLHYFDLGPNADDHGNNGGDDLGDSSIGLCSEDVRMEGWLPPDAISTSGGGPPSRSPSGGGGRAVAVAATAVTASGTSKATENPSKPPISQHQQQQHGSAVAPERFITDANGAAAPVADSPERKEWGESAARSKKVDAVASDGDADGGLLFAPSLAEEVPSADAQSGVTLLAHNDGTRAKAADTPPTPPSSIVVHVHSEGVGNGDNGGGGGGGEVGMVGSASPIDNGLLGAIAVVSNAGTANSSSAAPPLQRSSKSTTSSSSGRPLRNVHSSVRRGGGTCRNNSLLLSSETAGSSSYGGVGTALTTTPSTAPAEEDILPSSAAEDGAEPASLAPPQHDAESEGSSAAAAGVAATSPTTTGGDTNANSGKEGGELSASRFPQRLSFPSAASLRLQPTSVEDLLTCGADTASSAAAQPASSFAMAREGSATLTEAEEDGGGVDGSGIAGRGGVLANVAAHEGPTLAAVIGEARARRGVTSPLAAANQHIVAVPRTSPITLSLVAATNTHGEPQHPVVSAAGASSTMGALPTSPRHGSA